MTFAPLRKRPLLLAGLLLLVAVWFKNAWVCDDAYINFRVLDQIHAGHGPVWNPHERVQVYTSVLWLWLQVPLRAISADAYVNALALSLACVLGCLALLRRLMPDDRAWLLLCVLLVGASGFMDFTSSGLESPLVFLACALLLGLFGTVMTAPAADPAADRPLRLFLLAAGASLLVRHDLALLWLPPVLHAMVRHRRLWTWRRWLRALAVAAAPLLLWSAFALVYYGSPWPNPALAKLVRGADPQAVAIQGLRFLGTAGRDPVLAVVIVAGTALALARPATRALGVGILLHLLYLVRIGGDFMQGRMLSAVFLVAVVVLVRATAAWPRPRWTALAAAALLAAVLLPRSPLTSGRDLDRKEIENGVADERGYTFQTTSLWVRLRTPADAFPDHPWARAGRRENNRDSRIVGARNMGFFGYLAGVDKIIIDHFAITDPFLARIPVTVLPADWRPGHIERRTPRGYSRSLQTGRNDIADPRLVPLYRDVRLAVSGPLWSRERLAAIWRLNAGS